MDQPIEPRVRRLRWLKRVIPIVVFAGLGSTALALGPRMLVPGVARERLRTARVEEGPIEATLTATGTVVPEVEKVIASPVDARVLRVRKRAGDVLQKGDAILDLDLEAARLGVAKLDQEVALKANEQIKARLDLQARLDALGGEREVKTLELGAQRARTSRDRDLHARGFLSKDELDQSTLTEARVAAELKKVETEIRHAEQSNRALNTGLALARATVARDRDEARRVLDLATTKADRKAVLTYTLIEEGAAVKKGDVLARLADLSSFRVDASVSDLHASKLQPGTSVLVQIGEAGSNVQHLAGTIASVQPSVKDGAIAFSVALAERGNALLRPNLRVDVLVITGRKPRVLRVLRGPFADAEGRREIFVVRGGRAVRAPVEVGLGSATHLEIKHGLALGDEIVISDMTQYLGQRQLDLR